MVAFIVVEPGSDWSSTPRDDHDVVVIAPSTSLASATHAKLAALTSANRAVRIAILVCNQLFTPRNLAQRWEVARVLGRCAKRHHGCLLLCTGNYATPAVSHSLRMLARKVNKEVAATVASVQLIPSRIARPSASVVDIAARKNAPPVH